MFFPIEFEIKPDGVDFKIPSDKFWENVFASFISEIVN